MGARKATAHQPQPSDRCGSSFHTRMCFLMPICVLQKEGGEQCSHSTQHLKHKGGDPLYLSNNSNFQMAAIWYQSWLLLNLCITWTIIILKSTPFLKPKYSEKVKIRMKSNLKIYAMYALAKNSHPQGSEPETYSPFGKMARIKAVLKPSLSPCCNQRLAVKWKRNSFIFFFFFSV